MPSALSATENRFIWLLRQARTAGMATSGLRGAGRGSRGNSGAPPSGEGINGQPTQRWQQPCLSATATYTSARGRPRPFRAAPVAQQPWLRSSHCAARSRPSAPCHNNLHSHNLAVEDSSWCAGAEKGRGRARKSPTAERPSAHPPSAIRRMASAQRERSRSGGWGRRTPRSPLLGARIRCPLRPERPLVAAPGH
jgi:hypothetical protein